jgi:hypothetical protein
MTGVTNPDATHLTELLAGRLAGLGGGSGLAGSGGRFAITVASSA